ncbi:Zinc finger CCCH domain-containing protein 27 [Acorus gramineus]|uniref:Zinc finger CCCH domain-containing protein 27 n=1 Tax=Acorus gramineus TaxID=55184 RepID=A0AAV9BUA9_ACOGR|nr:Zinc finger CCCH domain-containing protein 27 [Acorus gramineus]
MSKENLTSNNYSVGHGRSSFTSVATQDVLAADHKNALHVNDGDFRPVVSDKQADTLEEDGVPKSSVSYKHMELLPVKRPIEASEGHFGDGKFLLTAVSTSCGEIDYSGDVENGLVTGVMTKSESRNGDVNGVICTEKEISHVNMETDPKSVADSELRASSLYPPQKSPRSPTPDATLVNQTKRPAIICDFFAKGWCIKGSSCKFLHVKDGVVNSEVIKEKSISIGKIQDDTGLKPEAVISRFSCFTQPLEQTNNDDASSSKSKLLLQRALVRAYGGEGHGHNQFNGENRPVPFPERFFSGIIPHNDGAPRSVNNNELQRYPLYREDPRNFPAFRDSRDISSPGSQYDPLLDSIEPRNEGKTSMQFFPGGLYHQASSDSLLTRSINPGSNIDEIMHSIPGSHEGSVERNASFPGPDGYGASAVATGNSKADFKTKSVHKEKHSANPDHVMEVANVNKLDSNSPKDQADKVKENKEPKALKFFRAALVESVKELVKPFWREGHLSKDAHKTIVKKAVDKVLGALQSHQIPSNTEAINQYLSSSRTKLVKLVEGYVEKYSKTRVPDEKQVVPQSIGKVFGISRFSAGFEFWEQPRCAKEMPKVKDRIWSLPPSILL